MRSNAILLLAVTLVLAVGCRKDEPESAYGSTDTIRTGAPTGAPATASTSTIGTTVTTGTITTNTSSATTAASSTGYATVPTDTTASTRTK